MFYMYLHYILYYYLDGELAGRQRPIVFMDSFKSNILEKYFLWKLIYFPILSFKFWIKYLKNIFILCIQ